MAADEPIALECQLPRTLTLGQLAQFEPHENPRLDRGICP